MNRPKRNKARPLLLAAAAALMPAAQAQAACAINVATIARPGSLEATYFTQNVPEWPLVIWHYYVPALNSLANPITWPTCPAMGAGHGPITCAGGSVRQVAWNGIPYAPEYLSYGPPIQPNHFFFSCTDGQQGGGGGGGCEGGSGGPNLGCGAD